MDISKEIRQRREELGISQELLAEVSSLSLRTLKTLESGKGNPTLASIKKLTEVLGLELKIQVKSNEESRSL